MLDNPFIPLYKRTETTVPNMPLYMDIELTNICNLSCKMCGTNYSKRPKGLMHHKTVDAIIHYVKKYKIPVRIIGWGEPTKHPNYKQIIEDIAQHVPVHINTNGYRALPKCLTSIKYSFHGQQNMKIYKDMSIVSGTTTDLEKAKSPKWVKAQKTDTRWIDGKNRSRKRFKRCGEVFDKVTILWTGDITMCCGDVEGKYVLGNINRYTLKDIWNNSSQLNAIRKELRKKNWSCTELCKKCYDYT